MCLMAIDYDIIVLHPLSNIQIVTINWCNNCNWNLGSVSTLAMYKSVGGLIPALDT